MNTNEYLNQLSTEQSRQKLAHCCGSQRWVELMLTARPYQTAESLSLAVERSFDALIREDWLEAFAAHPRIGNIDSLRAKFAATKQWAAGEQSAVAYASEQTLQELAEGNDLYLERFGYIFIICATGKSAPEMLSALQSRIHNDPKEELATAASEQRKITWLRLQKLSMPQRCPITTHILDTSRGMPAANVYVQLEQKVGTDFTTIAQGHTNTDGRINDWLPDGYAAPGTYRLTFGTTDYFNNIGCDSFFADVTITFHVTSAEMHYHVPLLLNPFGYSTYRGS